MIESSIVSSLCWIRVIDLIVVYTLVFGCLLMIKQSGTKYFIKIILLALLVVGASHYFDLTVLKWILERFAIVFIVLMLIIFQPELRRGFENIKNGRLFSSILTPDLPKNVKIIKHILTAVDNLSKQKIGALIVLELMDNLDDYVESGIQINGTITAELLVNLFWMGTPTHDGAVILRDNKIIAAGCLLPLTKSKIIDRRLGTRHMAAIGLSEHSDAVIVVVSEETGTVSLVENGEITRFLNREALETHLFGLYNVQDKQEGDAVPA